MAISTLSGRICNREYAQKHAKGLPLLCQRIRERFLPPTQSLGRPDCKDRLA